MTKIKNLDQWGPIDARILYNSFWFAPSAKYSNWPEMLGVYDHDRNTFYWDREMMQRGGEKALKEILNLNKRRKLWVRYNKLIKSMRRAARQNFISGREWYDYLNLFWRITLVVETANFAAPEYLRKKLEKLVPEKELNKVLETMLAPEKLSFHQQSELELFSAKDFKKYARQWFWLENSYYESRVLTAGYFRSQIKFLTKKEKEAKIKKIWEYTKAVRRQKVMTANKYHLPKEIMEQASAMAFSIWWQDHRKGITWWSNSITDKINKELSRRFNLTENELMHYTAEEWVNLSENAVVVSKKIIEKRKGLAVFEFLRNDFRLYYGKQARKIIGQWLPKEKKRKPGESLKGIVVSAGPAKKIRGRVSILNSPRFINKMKRGDILVAPMTSPDYIQAMCQAKAIITDVGGLMSHAAIISRELRVTCIVGTGIATKVLKDGDWVEVDAGRGVVRILKKN